SAPVMMRRKLCKASPKCCATVRPWSSRRPEQVSRRVSTRHARVRAPRGLLPGEAPARKPAAGSKARPHLDEQTGLGGRSGFGLLEFLALLFEDRPAAELNFVAFQRQNLYQDLIAFVQLVAYLLYGLSEISEMCSRPS